MITITFYGIDSDRATDEFRQKIKCLSTAFYDDYTDYFILYQVRFIRSEVSLTYIVFENDEYVCFDTKDYDISL